MKKLITLVAIAFICTVPVAKAGDEPKKPDENSKIQWLTIEEAYKRWLKEPRKIVIDVYTGWCGWCKVMDKNTFTNEAVGEFVNRTYYPVKFNAEQREDVVLGDKKFRFIAQGEGGVHELAVFLLNNQLGYPTTVFLDERMQIIQPVSGYLDPQMFHQVTTYFAGNYYRIEHFDNYKVGTYEKLFGKERTPSVLQPKQ